MADNPFDAVSYLAYSVFLFLYWGDACLFILMLIVLFGNGIRRRFMRSLSWYGGEKHKAVGGASKKRRRPTTANANALKLSCELLRIFVAEAVQRAAIIAEAEGLEKVEATHLERVLPQLLLDF
ncbi:uncharacterized protein LOC116249571 isoform X2 [Nymphaea colorata]|uniref:uncharacterized protein LOC116249571 isoform X2 n=1 Tax=Nymphaea colorata TaxID=210225 RepID=UPI00129DC17B|nr:uncharacterized protein LOC116249571 isoform X2 [Nymphaea colorata]